LSLAVLICLAAATVSLSAPSLRPVVRDLFIDYAPVVPQRYVNFLVGQSRASVEIDLAALDSRIEGLRGAIDAVASGAAPNSEEMKQFLTGTLTFGTARRLEENLARLESELGAFRNQSEAELANSDKKRAALVAQLTALETAAAEARNLLEARLETGEEADTALEGRLAVTESKTTTFGSLIPTIKEQLRATGDAIAPVAGRIDDLETKITAQEESVGGQIAAQMAAVEDLKVSVDVLAQTRFERIQPLLSILRLNSAIAANRSYKAPLDASAKALASISAVSGDAATATAIATLRRHESDSIPSRDQITRDFGAISQSVLVSQEPSRIESLRVSFVTLLDAALDKPAPPVSDQDQMKSRLRSIQAELSGGRLAEALSKAESLDPPKFRTKFNAWRAQVRARLEVDEAVASLEAMAFNHLGAKR
jgi:predicted  nucleic acid-binding Zn-ribbon protein